MDIRKYYDGNIHDKPYSKSNSYIKINSCGWYFPDTFDRMTVRKQGRLDYHIIYVLEGELRVKYLDQTYVAKRGGIVIYPPHIPHEYRDAPSTKRMMVHFSGSAVMQIFDEAHLQGGVYNRAYSRRVNDLFIALISEYKQKLAVNSQNGILISLLFELGKVIVTNSGDGENIDACARYIVENYNKEIASSALVEISHLSQSRFMVLFKKKYGISPKEYQKSIRIKSAEEMLVSTHLSIGEIALFVGYTDQLYFSRVFKKQTGYSPSKYRELPHDR